MSEVPSGESLAREHLANERTLLTWVRTGMNAIAVGVLLHVVAGLAGNLPGGTPLGHLLGRRSAAGDFEMFGVALVVFGALVQVGALVRFLRYRRELSRGELTSRAAVYLLLALGLVTVGVAYIGFVVIR